MRISKLVGPLFVLLALSVGVGCGVEETDEDSGSSEDAITGSVQAARIASIKQAYLDAKLEDFTPIAPLLDDAAMAAWNMDVQDAHWFSFSVSGRTVYLVDFDGDALAVTSGVAPAATHPREAFVLFFDAAADQKSYGAVLLYSADANKWEGLTRVLKDTKPAAPHSDGGAPHSDGGAPHSDGGAPHSDGGAPHSDGGAPHSDGGAPHSDGGAIVDAGPG